jgi:acyl carrier protein
MPALRDAARFSELRVGTGEGMGADAEGSLADRLAGKSRVEARAIVGESLAKVVATILRVPIERIAPDTSLMELGMDSLMGVELGLSAQQELGIDLPVGGLGAGVTLNGLVDRVMGSIFDEGMAAEASVAVLMQRHGVDEEAKVLHDLDRQEVVSASLNKVSLLS